MNNVLEHVSDPDSYFKHIQKILKPEGVAIIGVPNINSLLFKIFRQNWAELDLPRHLYHFNKQTLKQYCRKNKLALTKTRYNSVPFEFTGSIFYFLNSFRKNRKTLSESWMNKSKVFALLMLPFCHILSWLRMGGRIEVCITKKI
jgi:SAM-dependent methyltransferase